MKKIKGIWISYDFGLKGDYSGLYKWLDNHKAIECGIGLAFIKYEVISESSDFKIVDEISEKLKESVKLSKSDRVYIIWKDDIEDKVKGRFLNGNRKQSPWEGYGNLSDVQITDTE
jgi:hypothetical protein